MAQLRPSLLPILLWSIIEHSLSDYSFFFFIIFLWIKTRWIYAWVYLDFFIAPVGNLLKIVKSEALWINVQFGIFSICFSSDSELNDPVRTCIPPPSQISTTRTISKIWCIILLFHFVFLICLFASSSFFYVHFFHMNIYMTFMTYTKVSSSQSCVVWGLSLTQENIDDYFKKWNFLSYLKKIWKLNILNLHPTWYQILWLQWWAVRANPLRN